MLDRREDMIERLLGSLEGSYDIHRFSDGEDGIVARCDYYESVGKYVLHPKAELWSAKREEFLYLIALPHLGLDGYESLRKRILADGMERIHVGPGHMSSYISLVFVCDTCEPEARKALMKCRITKSFRFSIHGWMEVHTALLECGMARISSNRGGCFVAKHLKNVFATTRK